MIDLIDVASEVRRLQRVVSDKEWEGQDPRFELRELEHYRSLLERGVLLEPMF